MSENRGIILHGPVRQKLSLLALLFAVGLSARGETPVEIAAALGHTMRTNSGAFEIVRDLTTDIGPRLAGSDAEKRAAQWAKKRFEQFGFDRVSVETFPLEHGWARGEEKAEVILPSPQPLVVTALGGSVATAPEGIEAEIALFKTYDELLAQPTNSLAGRIAVVTEPMIRTQDGSGYGAAHRIRGEGPAQAARRGAVAFLMRSLGTDSHRLAHAGETAYETKGLRIPAGALSVPDAEQLERLAARGPVRVKLLLTPRDLGSVTSQNVIAEIKGSEKPDEVVLLGAHLDCWDLGTGAIDDGAGVGIVMAASKGIHDLVPRPKRTIRVVLFGSEECGLWGGKAYADMHKADLDHIVIAAEPDFGQGPIYRFETGVANPDEWTLNQIRFALAPLGVIRGENGSHGESDIEPMAGLHVPVVTLQLDGRDYFDFHHTADDTFDKIEPERINQSAAVYAVFTYLAAELGGDYRAKASVEAKSIAP
ncbi:MAG TPA: M20/M25/M40 family metallo-hydrolase [Verrucomicrobiae bacterium]|nr:M20/M25/M40 family metallo-hydrolase [Verrucomicrobiae bacterium]